MRPLVTVAVPGLAIVATSILTACSGGTGIDASCDVAGVTDEIEHILSDSDAALGETLSLSCAEDWSVATVMVEAPAGDTEETFVFRGLEGEWVLTSSVEACDAAGPLAAPESLRSELCPS